MAAQVLQEYLVRLGFQTDAVSFGKFEEKLGSVGSKLFKIGVAATATAVTMEVAAQRFSYRMRSMYYSSQLAKTSVANMRSMEVAAEKIGISADAMASSIQNVGVALRITPGLRELATGLTGVNQAGRDTADVMFDIVNATKNMPEWQGAQLAGMFGMSSEQYLLWRDNSEKMRSEYKKTHDTLDKYGFGNKEQTDAAIKYADTLDDIKVKGEAIESAVLTKVLPTFTKFAEEINVLVGALNAVNTALGLIAASTALSALTTLFGRGAAGAAAAGAGAAGAGAAGAGAAGAAGGALARGAALGASAFGVGVAGAGGWLAGSAIYGAMPESARMAVGGTIAEAIGEGAPAASATAGKTRNLRNNNPGNIRYGKFAAKYGATGQDKNGFAIFPSMQAGWAALDGLLASYGGKGIGTVSGVIGRWAPPNENDTGAYASYMRSRMGGEKVDLSDPSVRAKLATGIARYEGMTNAQIASTRLGMAGGEKSVNIKQEVTVNASGGDAKEIAKETVAQSNKALSTTGRNIFAYMQ